MFRHAQRPCARPNAEELIKQLRSSWLYGLMMMMNLQISCEWLNQPELNMLISWRPSLRFSIAQRSTFSSNRNSGVSLRSVKKISILFCVFTATGIQLFKSIEQKSGYSQVRQQLAECCAKSEPDCKQLMKEREKNIIKSDLIDCITCKLVQVFISTNLNCFAVACVARLSRLANVTSFTNWIEYRFNIAESDVKKMRAAAAGEKETNTKSNPPTIVVRCEGEKWSNEKFSVTRRKISARRLWWSWEIYTRRTFRKWWLGIHSKLSCCVRTPESSLLQLSVDLTFKHLIA